MIRFIRNFVKRTPLLIKKVGMENTKKIAKIGERLNKAYWCLSREWVKKSVELIDLVGFEKLEEIAELGKEIVKKCDDYPACEFIKESTNTIKKFGYDGFIEVGDFLKKIDKKDKYEASKTIKDLNEGKDEIKDIKKELEINLLYHKTNELFRWERSRKENKKKIEQNYFNCLIMRKGNVEEEILDRIIECSGFEETAINKNDLGWIDIIAFDEAGENYKFELSDRLKSNLRMLAGVGKLDTASYKELSYAIARSEGLVKLDDELRERLTGNYSIKILKNSNYVKIDEAGLGYVIDREVVVTRDNVKKALQVLGEMLRE